VAITKKEAFMLINTSSKFAARDVLAIKFVNGEEIIATFVKLEGTTYTVTKPVIMQLVPVGNGQGAVQFAPFMLGIDDDEEYVFEADRLLVNPVKARKDAASQYMKATSSIELVGGQGLL
jgi:hypothetical protein